MKKKKLLLVYPKNLVGSYGDTTAIKMLGEKGVFMNPSLGTVAALSPPEYDIKIIDENVEPIDFDEPYDLVGVTGLFFHLPRARRIAGEFSKRGITIVCGGPSVTLSPESWRPFSDVLIIGEAERIWPQFAKDFLTGSYKKEYRETERFDLSISPIPNYSRFSKNST